MLKKESTPYDSSKTKNTTEEILKTIPKYIKPVFGYRFIITGDFDGDGKKEKLIEHFFSGVDNKETNKFYDGLSDYDQLVALTVKKEPISFVLSDNKNIDTLNISSTSQLLGLSLLKNEGDLNGDGTDEVSYVINWADWSNLNTWHIVTCKNKKWQELYSFSIRDWQLPDLPETFTQYGLSGLENKNVALPNDTVNNRIEKEFTDFKGLVTKIKNNTIRIIFMNDEADLDTMMVNLKRKEPRHNIN
ncbi:hypothetical protein GCM10027043_38960 [Ferruginibacter profundus]